MGDEPFDEVGFNAWLAGDPRRRSAFDSMWRRVMGPDMDAALQAYGRRGLSRRTLLVSGAAALLALVGGYKALPLIELRLAEVQQYTAADSAIREVKLADGTQLTLGGGADVKVRYTSHNRVVELTNGTIFVNVVHDKRRPFQIDTGNARIVDIGTSFEVLSRPGNVRVTVATGVVQFGRNGWLDKPITLTEKQGATLDETGLNRIADVSLTNVARWRSGWVEYKGAPLRQVIADIQSLSPMPIEIRDASLASKLVSGRIRLTDPAGQLENLSIIHAFRVRQTNNMLIISKE